METLTIGELAKRGQVNRETVRYYERRRLLPPPSRSVSGYRIFSDEALRRLRFIRHAKALGFSLNEIRELLALRVNSIGACDRVQERTRVKLADIDKKIRSLKQVKDALCELVDACARRKKSNACPILDNLDANGWFDQDSSATGKTRHRRTSIRVARKVRVSEEQMKVELFYVDECPNYREAARMLREALGELGFRDEISEIKVTDSAQADALAFIGSPSIRIEGKDIEPIASHLHHYGLSCRTYLVGGKLIGVPPLDMIRAAICSVTSSENTDSKGK